MAGDPLQHVQSGDPLAIQAETFNCLIDAARDYKQRTRHLGRSSKFSPPNPTVVSVRNDTGSDQPRFAVLGLDRPIILPTDNLAEFSSRATAVGVEPTTEHRGRWCLLAEPIPDGAIGKAYVAGISPVLLDVQQESDRYAEVEEGTTSYLVSGGNGSAVILWKEDGTGAGKWAVVRFGDSRPVVRKAEMIDTLQQGDASPASAWLMEHDGTAWQRTSEQIDVYGDRGFRGVAFGSTPEVDAGDQIDVYYSHEAGEWYVIVGAWYFHGDIVDDIAAGAQGQVRLNVGAGSDTREITVSAYSPYTAVKAGDFVSANWNTFSLHWDVGKFQTVAIGCGLHDDGGTIKVQPADLDGFGLRESDDTEDCELEVNPDDLAGCGLASDGPGQPLKIDRPALRGYALLDGTGTCDVDVDTPTLAGCGLTTDGPRNPLKFDAATVVGFGLAAINECGLAVDTSQLVGCGLIPNLVTGVLDVDPVTLAGPGLLSFGLCGLQVDTGCGLAIVGNEVVFDPTLVAGVDSGLDTEGACGLKVRTGCGIKIELGSVTFDAASVAGAALYASPGTCLLNVSVGDGLEIVADTIVVKAGCSLITNGLDGSLEVDVPTLAGDGLIRSAGVTCDELAVQPGCGLEIAANKSVQVRRIELLGEGLKAGDGSDCELAVDWEEFPGGCGLQLNAGFWDIDNETIAGEGLAAGIGCTLGVAVGCGIQIDADAVAVNPVDLESDDIGPTGLGCALETKGATCTVTVVEDVTVDEYGDLVVTKRNLDFVNGLLKDCDAA